MKKDVKFPQDTQEEGQYAVLQQLLLMCFAVRTWGVGEALKVLIMFFCHTCPQTTFLALHHNRGYITGVMSARSNSYGRSHQNLQQMVLPLRVVNVSRLCEGDQINANQDYCRTKWKRQCWHLWGEWYWKNTLKFACSLGFLNEFVYNEKEGGTDMNRSLKICCPHTWDILYVIIYAVHTYIQYMSCILYI